MSPNVAMKNFDRMSPRDICVACLREMHTRANEFEILAKCYEAMMENPHGRIADVILLVELWDGEVAVVPMYCINCNTRAEIYMPFDIDVKTKLIETLDKEPLYGGYTIEEYGRQYYAQPHTIEELSFDNRFRVLFAREDDDQ